MINEGYSFEQKTAQRVVSATRYVENMQRGIGAQQTFYQPGMYGFWAEIQDKYVDSDTGNTLYSWEQLFPGDWLVNQGLQEDDGTQNLRSGIASGNDFAIEAKFNDSVPFGTNVFMRPALQDNYYVFEYWGEPGCWAVIARPTDPTVNQYSWTKLEPQLGGGFALSDTVGGNWINPSGWAQEIQGSTVVLSNERVWLTKTQDFFTFYYSGGVAFCNSPSGGIGAGSSANCIVNTIDSILVYNPWTVAIPASTKIAISYSPLQVSWYVTAQNCTS